MKPLTASLEDALGRMEAMATRCADFEARWSAWSLGQPQALVCEPHREARPIDAAESLRVSWGRQEFAATYRPCSRCAQEARLAKESDWMIRAGVPPILAGASFSGWMPRGNGDDAHAKAVEAYATSPVGALVLISEQPGTGKSFLAAAALRQHQAGLFITNADLLLKLRRSYRDDRAEDVTAACQRAKLLVLDDLGMSAGGRDELPLLHAILDARHGYRKPTIITTNLMPEKLRECIGERMADRLRQSANKVLIFCGGSVRRGMREEYMTNERKAGR